MRDLRFVQHGWSNFQLDIVGFLAILGEGSVLVNSQVAALSNWSFLPRLLPAPQALLRPSRPSDLEPNVGWVAGVHSGNQSDHVNHIGNIVIDAESMPAFSVRCVEIVRRNKNDVTAKAISPLTGVALLGMTFSIILLALSLWNGDGWALVADLCLSFLSTLIGLGNRWRLQLPKRKSDNPNVPHGDVVIRYPKGSFLVVKCDENVARELYFAPENIDYMIAHAPAYRLIALVGTILLMFGVIALANAEIWLQIGFAIAYMLMNAAYWLVAALPARLHWDTSCFEVKPQRLETAKVHKHGHYTDENESFTEALWKVMVVTKSKEWAVKSEAAPQTPAWSLWLKEAKFVTETAGCYDEKDPSGTVVRVWKVPDWDPRKNLGECMAQAARELEAKGSPGNV